MDISLKSIILQEIWQNRRKEYTARKCLTESTFSNSFFISFLTDKFLDYSQFLSEARVNLELVSNSYHEATSIYLG